jgi:predicted ATPase
MGKNKKTPQEILQYTFGESDRFRLYGEILTRMVVNGFRNHKGTDIEIRSPVTAFCGLNGAGKSTLIQLAATAYANTTGESYFVQSFFVKNPALDRDVFSSNTFVRFEYWQPERKPRYKILRRNQGDKHWSGYKDRPSRAVYFAGVSHYIPLWERPRDFLFRYADKLVVSSHEEIAFKRSGEILGLPYSRRVRHNVQYKAKSNTLLSVGCRETDYSETNMGFGEARVQAILDDLERLPPKSLILFEEPETSLHPKAQYRLGEYLIGLAVEKGHQILLTTHSDWLLRALPPESIIFLQQAAEGVRLWPGLQNTYATSLMSEGTQKALTILVEDECAKIVLSEIIRLVDPNFLTQAVRIVPAGFRDPANQSSRGGGHDAIRRVMETLRRSKLRLAAVLDGDQTPDPEHQIFTLPGKSYPEAEIMACQRVQEVFKTRYNLTPADVRSLIADEPHQRYFSTLAELLAMPTDSLAVELAREYTQSLPPVQRENLVQALKEAGR